MADNEDLSSIIGDHLSDAIAFDGEDRADSRVRALEYLQGIMHDLPNEPGRSSSVTSELSDVISWMMPGLMRVFAGAGGVVEYQARDKRAKREQKRRPNTFRLSLTVSVKATPSFMIGFMNRFCSAMAL